ncbi:MAG: helix-turn-helix domain-containing protein [Pseudomonadota bacterium]
MAIDDALEKGSRRTQKQRSHEMRQRLVEATVQCLDEEGYANTSVSRIVERTGVSRGAHLHHFRSKNALMRAVAEEVMRSVFKAAGETALGVQDRAERFPALVRFMWRDVMCSREGRVMLELMHAARLDKDLAKHLRPLMLRTIRLYRHAAKHYFMPASEEAADMDSVLFLVQWTLRGMLFDAPLVRHPEFYDRHLDALIALLAPHIRNKDVDAPPTRPAAWDRKE